MIVPLLVLGVFLLYGCNSVQPATVPVQPDTVAVTEDKGIECSSFNSKPELWYIQSGTQPVYYTYIPAKEFNHPKYEIGKSQVEDEEMIHGFGENAAKLTKNEIIQRHGKLCTFGRATGQSINNLYCQPIEYSAIELSSDGQILSNNLIKIEAVFSIDKSTTREDTNGGYMPVEDAELESQECRFI